MLMTILVVAGRQHLCMVGEQVFWWDPWQPIWLWRVAQWVSASAFCVLYYYQTVWSHFPLYRFTPVRPARIMHLFHAAEQYTWTVLLAQGSHSNDQTGASGETQPEFVRLFNQFFHECLMSTAWLAAKCASHQWVEYAVVGAQPPLGPGNQPLQNEVSRSSVAGGHISNEIADGLQVVEHLEMEGPGANGELPINVPARRPPRQGHASSQGSHHASRSNVWVAARVSYWWNIEDVVQIGEHTCAFESQLTSFTGILQDLSAAVQEPV